MIITYPPPLIPQTLRRGIVWFLLFISLGIMSQNNNDFYDCGTTPKQNSYLSDKYFGDNQKLVDILLTNNVNINSNYLQEIQNGENQEITSERFTSSSTSYEIPVKIWIYKDNNGLNNISISQAKQELLLKN